VRPDDVARHQEVDLVLELGLGILVPALCTTESIFREIVGSNYTGSQFYDHELQRKKLPSPFYNKNYYSDFKDALAYCNADVDVNLKVVGLASEL
jgi:hypothetical protein